MDDPPHDNADINAMGTAYPPLTNNIMMIYFVYWGVMKFTGKEIHATTSSFDISKHIGEGGYSVFKGKLRRTAVATVQVKKVDI